MRYRTYWGSSSVQGLILFSSHSDNSIQTMITFDQGGRWKHLRKPENSECDATAKNKNEVCFTPIVLCIQSRAATLFCSYCIRPLNSEVQYLIRVISKVESLKIRVMKLTQNVGTRNCKERPRFYGLSSKEKQYRANHLCFAKLLNGNRMDIWVGDQLGVSTAAMSQQEFCKSHRPAIHEQGKTMLARNKRRELGLVFPFALGAFPSAFPQLVGACGPQERPKTRNTKALLGISQIPSNRS